MYINRQRQLPHEDWKDPRLVVLPPPVRHLATGLRMMADAEGRGPVNLHLIRSNAFPSPDMTGWWPELGDIEEYMLLLDESEWLKVYPNPNPAAEGPEQTLFQILAKWPHVSREGDSRLPPPPHHPPVSPSGIFPGSGERESESVGAGESGGESAGVRAGAGEGLAGTTHQPAPSIRIPPSSFCSAHIGGPPEGLDCRDCGTARNRHQRYGELRAARQQALTQGGVLGAMACQAIEAEMRALEDAAALALLGGVQAQPVEEPVEFIDADGRIEST
ncbi:MAG: hypothetical protein WC829_03320 [Hyphomicrobium sp.]|jgi:hypothetical protein